MITGANLLDPMDFKSPEWTSTAQIEEGSGNRSVHLQLTAPIIGYVMSLINSLSYSHNCIVHG